MNRSLFHVLENTTSPAVFRVAEFLMQNRNRKVSITFLKKDGLPRSMQLVPNFEYNSTFGIRSTDVGRKIVASKSDNDMITVQEILEDGHVQPRTVNLAKVIEYHVA